MLYIFHGHDAAAGFRLFPGGGRFLLFSDDCCWAYALAGNLYHDWLLALSSRCLLYILVSYGQRRLRERLLIALKQKIWQQLACSVDLCELSTGFCRCGVFTEDRRGTRVSRKVGIKKHCISVLFFLTLIIERRS